MTSQLAFVSQDLNERIELGLSNQIVFNLSMVGIMYVVFVIVRLIFPKLFAPRDIDYHLNPVFFVFQLPFIKAAEFARRGNNLFMLCVSAMYIFWMISSFTLFTVPLLLIYGSGNNQEFQFATIFSKFTIQHLDMGAITIVFPVAIQVLLCYYIIMFYEQYKLLYIFWRQRCMFRAAPQNFVVMLKDLPKQIKTLSDLTTVLKGCFTHAAAIVPTLPNQEKIDKLYRMIMKLEDKKTYLLHDLDGVVNNILDKENIKKNAKALRRKLLNKLNDIESQLRNAKYEVLAIRDNSQLDFGHLQGLQQIPPPLPSIITSFQYFSNPIDQLPNVESKDAKLMKQKLQKSSYATNNQILIKQLQLQHVNELLIGRHCFIIFQSQREAAKAVQTRIFVKGKKPEQVMAPAPESITWKYLKQNKHIMIIKKILSFGGILLAIFCYLQLWNGIYAWLETQAQQIYDFLQIFVPRFCTANQQNSACKFYLNMLASMSIGMPRFMNSLIQVTIPSVFKGLVEFPGFYTPDIVIKRTYLLSYSCLIFMSCLSQIFMINGKVDILSNFQLLYEMNIQDYFQLVASNINTNVFELIGSVTSRYIVMPIFYMFRFDHIWFCILRKIFGSKREKERALLYHRYNYFYRLAYLSHMLTLCLTFMIQSPIVLFICWLSVLFEMVVFRYNILQCYYPNQLCEVSNAYDVFENVMNQILYGYLLQLVCMLFHLISGIQYAINIACVCVICLLFIVTLYMKYQIDGNFNQAQTNLLIGGEKIDIDREFKFEGERGYSKNIKYLEILKNGASNDSLKSIFRGHLKNQYIDQKMHYSRPWVSYVQSKTAYYDDLQCELANEESIGNYILTRQEIKNVAACYTHPAFQHVQVYGPDCDGVLV